MAKAFMIGYLADGELTTRALQLGTIDTLYEEMPPCTIPASPVQVPR